MRVSREGAHPFDRIGGGRNAAGHRLEDGSMALVGAAGGEEQQIRGTVVLGQIRLVIARPDHSVGEAEGGGEGFEGGAVLAVADDHQAAGNEAAQMREGVQSLFEAAAKGDLADDRDDRLILADAVQRAGVRSIRSELPVIERRRGEGRHAFLECGCVAKVVVDDEEQIGAVDEGAREEVGAQNATRVKGAGQPHLVIARQKAGQPMVVGEVRVDDVESVAGHDPLEGLGRPMEGHRVLGFLDERMGEVAVGELCLQLVSADIGVVGIHAGEAQCLDFGKGWRRGAGPSISRGEVEDFQLIICRLIYSRPMAVDQELLEILACPLCKEEVKLVPLAETRRASVRDKFREKFRNEEPVVEQGLQCVRCHRVYPIVSDIPVMLVEEAFEEN